MASLAQAGLTGIRFVVKDDITKENIGTIVNGLSETYKNKILPLISNFRTIPAISYDFSNNRFMLFRNFITIINPSSIKIIIIDA